MKDRLDDAEEKEDEAIGKLNWVLHRLPHDTMYENCTSERSTQCLEMDQGFGKAFIPSENVAKLMEEVSNIQRKNKRKNKKERPQTAPLSSSSLIEPAKWNSPFLKRLNANNKRPATAKFVRKNMVRNVNRDARNQNYLINQRYRPRASTNNRRAKKLMSKYIVGT